MASSSASDEKRDFGKSERQGEGAALGRTSSSARPAAPTKSVRTYGRVKKDADVKKIHQSQEKSTQKKARPDSEEDEASGDFEDSEDDEDFEESEHSEDGIKNQKDKGKKGKGKKKEIKPQPAAKTKPGQGKRAAPKDQCRVSAATTLGNVADHESAVTTQPTVVGEEDAIALFERKIICIMLTQVMANLTVLAGKLVSTLSP